MLVKQVRTLGTKSFGYFISKKRIHQKLSGDVSEQFEPVQIKMPWGHVDGKLWGSRDKQPVLAVHGWMDNAGTFDSIAPLLLKNSSILAIDLPGHGLSSWLPAGIPYNEQRYFETMRRIVKYFGWEKVKLLGHSMGAILSFNYTRLFPEETQFVISIDALVPFPNNPMRQSQVEAKSIDRLIAYEQKFTDNPPSYPEDVAIQKWLTNTVFKSLDIPSVKTLMIRGTKRKADGTYYYTRDYRLTLGFDNNYSDAAIKAMIQLVKCPYFAIIADNVDASPNRQIYWKTYGSAFKECNPNFNMVHLPGNHHLHMITPEPSANEINAFLEKYDI